MIESITHLNLMVLNVGLAYHNADWNWDLVNSPFARIYYVTEGQAQLLLPNLTLQLRPNHMYIIPPFTTHSYKCNNIFTHYYLHIYEDDPRSSGILEEWSFPSEIQAGDFELRLFERLCVLNPGMALPHSNPVSYDNNPTLIRNIVKNRQGTISAQIESKGIIFQLFSRFLHEAKSANNQKDKRIYDSLSYIKRHIYQEIPLDELAQRANITKDYYIRLFKSETGSTPQQYISQKKIEQAQLFLATGNTPIKSIAYQLGFEDHSYFNRLFRKRTGYTPMQYRKTIQQTR
jgi:AraC-like DNA-binding protein